MTETELKLIAAAAIIGLSKIPKTRKQCRGNRYTERVVTKSEKQVLANIADRHPAETTCAYKAVEATLNENNIGTFDGDVRSGAHGDTDIRLCERRGIVYSVTRHRNDPAF